MSHKIEAKNKIDAASVACDKALESWRNAGAVLCRDVSINGFGILRDRYAFRQQLHETQAHIAASLAALDEVSDWPNDFDYDQL